MDSTLRFLVVGDWGRQGAYNQSVVALSMGAAAASVGGVSFVVSTGDNVYDAGIRNVNGARAARRARVTCADAHSASLPSVWPGADPLWLATFTNIYTHPALQVPWYAVMGNQCVAAAATAGTLAPRALPAVSVASSFVLLSHLSLSFSLSLARAPPRPLTPRPRAATGATPRRT